MWEDLSVHAVGATTRISRNRAGLSLFNICVVKIRRMRFAGIERDDHAFMLDRLYVFHPVIFSSYRAQLAHAFIAIFAQCRSRSFPRSVVGSFGKTIADRIVGRADHRF